MKQMIEKKMKRYSEILKQIEERKKSAPKGTLKITKKKGKPYYYWQYKDESGKLVQQYINGRNRKIAHALAQKRYEEKVYPVIQKNLKCLENFCETYQFNRCAQIYQEMGLERQALVEPYECDVDSIIRMWKEETYEQNQEYTESLRYETDRGEIVRSKSEVIIANILYQNKNRLDYKYERPLRLSWKDKEIIVRPDFTILNLRTGKITYWEHAGIMDQGRYVSDFIWKNNLYIENHLMPGRNVFYSYESMTNPLDNKIVKMQIQYILEELDKIT